MEVFPLIKLAKKLKVNTFIVEYQVTGYVSIN